MVARTRGRDREHGLFDRETAVEHDAASPGVKSNSNKVNAGRAGFSFVIGFGRLCQNLHQPHLLNRGKLPARVTT